MKRRRTARIERQLALDDQHVRERVDTRASLPGTRRKLRKMANEVAWKLLLHLSGDPANQVVVVEEPLRSLRERPVVRGARGEVLLGTLERARDGGRREQVRDEPPRALGVSLRLGERVRIRLEVDEDHGIRRSRGPHSAGHTVAAA